MNYIHRYLLTLLAMIVTLLAIVFSASAQDKFKVLAVRGQVTVGGSQIVRIGTKLKQVDRLTVGKGAYISLVHNNGRTFELKKDGQYKISELDAAAVKKTKSATSKYTNYIVSELTEVKEPVPVSKNRRAHMRTTGSVERAVGDEVNVLDSVLKVVGGPDELYGLAVVQNTDVKNGDHLTLIQPRSSRLLPGVLNFVWYAVPGIKSYKLEIRTKDNAVILSVDAADTVYSTTTEALRFQPTTLYYYTVSTASVATQEFSLYVVGALDAKDVSEFDADIRTDFEESDAAVMHLTLASLFEDYGLAHAAQESYKATMQAAPDVWNYKVMYSEFLRRRGLNLEAYSLLW